MVAASNLAGVSNAIEASPSDTRPRRRQPASGRSTSPSPGDNASAGGGGSVADQLWGRIATARKGGWPRQPFSLPRRARDAGWPRHRRAGKQRGRRWKNRESKTGPGDRSRYPRRTSAFREWRRIQDPENGAERRGLCDHHEFGAGDQTGWLTRQSDANPSPHPNSLPTGNLQGIFQFWAVFCNFGLLSTSNFNGLEQNSLRNVTGNSIHGSRESFRANREFNRGIRGNRGLECDTMPGRASRCLHAGCRPVGIRISTELIPEEGSPPRFDIT